MAFVPKEKRRSFVIRDNFEAKNKMNPMPVTIKEVSVNGMGRLAILGMSMVAKMPTTMTITNGGTSTA
jgi:hypothetical protein